MTAILRMNGRDHKIINRFIIPGYLEDEYCNSDAVFIDRDLIIEKFGTHTCSGCGRGWGEASKPTKFVCRVRNVNHSIGYPVPICIDCFYYCESLAGSPTPKSFQELFNTGFTPRLIWEYL